MDDAATKTAGTEGRRDTAREVVEVEVERIGAGPRAPQEPGQTPLAAFGDRLWRKLAPVLLAMFLDAGDLVTPGALGTVGLPLGMVLGYVYGGFLDVPPTLRIGITVVTGLYFMMPMTAWIPIATITAAVVQIVAPERLKHEPFA